MGITSTRAQKILSSIAISVSDIIIRLVFDR